MSTEPTPEAYEAAALAFCRATYPRLAVEEYARYAADRRDLRSAVDAVWPIARAAVLADLSTRLREKSPEIAAALFEDLSKEETR